MPWGLRATTHHVMMLSVALSIPPALQLIDCVSEEEGYSSQGCVGGDLTDRLQFASRCASPSVCPQQWNGAAGAAPAGARCIMCGEALCRTGATHMSGTTAARALPHPLLVACCCRATGGYITTEARYGFAAATGQCSMQSAPPPEADRVQLAGSGFVRLQPWSATALREVSRADGRAGWSANASMLVGVHLSRPLMRTHPSLPLPPPCLPRRRRCCSRPWLWASSLQSCFRSTMAGCGPPATAKVASLPAQVGCRTTAGC